MPSGPSDGLAAPGSGHWGFPWVQIDYYCRLDCLWKKKFRTEQEEFETMENVNRLLLENVLPAHVAAHFIGDKLNEVGRGDRRHWRAGGELQHAVAPPQGLAPLVCLADCVGISCLRTRALPGC